MPASPEEIEQALESAFPVLQAAIEALNCLNKKDLDELRCFRSPPPLVVMVLEAVCVLMRIEIGDDPWKTARNKLLKGNLVEKLVTFDKDSISRSTLEHLAVYTEILSYEVVKAVSCAAASLFSFVVAMGHYGAIAGIIKAMREGKPRPKPIRPKRGVVPVVVFPQPQAGSSGRDPSDLGLVVFDRWFEAMVAAGQELRGLADPAWKPLPAHTRCMSPEPLFQALTGPLTPPDLRPLRPQQPGQCGASFTASGRSAPRPTASSAGAVLLHLGGAGCSLGASTWDRLWADQGMGVDGKPTSQGCGPSHALFAEGRDGRLVPRAIFADAEEAGLAKPLAARLFDSRDLLAGSGGTGGNFALGRSLRIGAEVVEAVRRQLERVDSADGVVLTCAAHGGTGGGLAAKLLRELADDQKVRTWSVALLPSTLQEQEPTLKEVWNAAFTFGGPLLDFSTVVTLLDNAALSLATRVAGAEEPALSAYNLLVGRFLTTCLSPLTTSGAIDALQGARKIGLRTLFTNITPYPRIHFTVPTFASLQDSGDRSADGPSDIAWRCLKGTPLASVNIAGGKTMGGALFCRGGWQPVYCPWVDKYRAEQSFSSWCPTGLLVGRSQPPHPATVDAACLHNSTAVGDLLDSLLEKLKGTVSEVAGPFRDAGMEEMEMVELLEDLYALRKDYDEVAAELSQ